MSVVLDRNENLPTMRSVALDNECLASRRNQWEKVEDSRETMKLTNKTDILLVSLSISPVDRTETKLILFA